jgi:Family of unknown function (DUF6221)
MPNLTLAEFVLARLAEATDDAERGYLKAPELPGWTGWDKTTTVGIPPAVAAVVLADLAAKRSIVAHCEAALRHPERAEETVPWFLAVTTLRSLALPYAGHEGYRAEWAPDQDVSDGGPDA